MTDPIEINIENPFEECVFICNEEHLKTCDCQDKLKKEFVQKHIHEIDEDVKRYGSTVKDIYHIRYDQAKRQALKDTAKHCIENNIKCPKEKVMVKKLIKIFIDKYKEKCWKEPKIYFSIRSIINSYLNSYRSGLFASSDGMFKHVFDKYGTRRLELSPASKAQLDFDSSVVSIMEKMDKMINGVKNVNIDIKAEVKNFISIDDIYGKLDLESKEKLIRVDKIPYNDDKTIENKNETNKE